MAKYINCLPQLVDDNERFFLIDGGLETTLVFDKKMDLPQFAAFVLMRTEEGRKTWKDYLTPYINIAKDFKASGYIIEPPTWRASPVWAEKIGGITREEVGELNRVSIRESLEIRKEFETDEMPIIICGIVGPMGDGYEVSKMATVEEAKEYHSFQIKAFASEGADYIQATTMNYPNEAIGIVKACEELKIPVVISFTVETNGMLPSGHSLKDAIEMTEAACETKPVYYQLNCCHYDHFMPVLRAAKGEEWLKRIQSVLANPSRKSHAELDEATELDSGDPMEFGRLTGQMKKLMPWMKVFGGCCGSNEKHIEQIAVTLKSLVNL